MPRSGENLCLRKEALDIFGFWREEWGGRGGGGSHMAGGREMIIGTVQLGEGGWVLDHLQNSMFRRAGVQCFFTDFDQ